MSTERHRRIESLFDRAVDIREPGPRDQFVVESCAGDESLCEELRGLLASYDTWTSMIPLPAPAPLRCGPYECVAPLGSGGMGAVYRARRADGAYQQDVAVKFLRGWLHSDPYVARFVAERQILANLNHPNISRLLDGGMTPAGEPYLVMELVEGEPLDRYCDQRKLNITARLDLFHQILDAVDYAHRNLVVHRDLKPSNILVTRDGGVRLLDFGTSKLLLDEETITGAAAFTPGFASPEQLRGEPAATTDDVFSLGVILFRLLTGDGPFDSHLGASLDRALRHAAPPRPETLPEPAAAEARSTTVHSLRAALAGDLSSILRKALAHDPALRYPSVAALADDLRRYREHRPVLARAQNWSYLAARGLRRHYRAFAAAVLLAATLAAATVFSLRQAASVRREADRAEAANRFLTDIFSMQARDPRSDSELTVRELLALAELRVTPLLGADPPMAADMDYVLGHGFFSQGDLPKARSVLERTLQRARQGNDIPRQASAIATLSMITYSEGRFDRARKEAQESLTLFERNPSAFAPPRAVALLFEAGTTLLYARPHDIAHRRFLERALALTNSHPGRISPSVRASCLQRLAESYINVDRRNAEARALLLEAVAIARSDPTQGNLLFECLQSLGRANRFLDRLEEDAQAQREALDYASRHFGPNHARTHIQRANWAHSLLGLQRMEEAYQESRAALAGMREWMPVPGMPLLRTNLAAAAHAACLTRRFAECESLAREGIRALGSDPQPGDLRVTDLEALLGLSLSGQTRLADARPFLLRALERNRSLDRRPIYFEALEAARQQLPP
jgi:eukaryotic-like serine/threonine-protein kinase